MNISHACVIIETIAADFGESVLKTLIYMGDHLEDFSDSEVMAYRVFMADCTKLLAPKECV